MHRIQTFVGFLYFFYIYKAPNYCIKYYDHIVNWRSGTACDWCALLDIANILALKLLQKLPEL